MLRLPTADGSVLTAGQFMPAAVRVGLASACDLEAVRLGIERLARSNDPVAINVAPWGRCAISGCASRSYRWPGPG